MISRVDMSRTGLRFVDYWALNAILDNRCLFLHISKFGACRVGSACIIRKLHSYLELVTYLVDSFDDLPSV